MAQFFKFSCSVFWLIWMFILSFFFGVTHIESKYTFIQTVDEIIVRLILYASITGIVMAFVGCFCIKCDISHICCAFLYVGPFVTAVLTLCIYMILLTIRMHLQLKPGDVLQLVLKEYQTKNRIPSFLQFTQTHYRCCGVYGLKDYRAFILPSTINQDVPFSCCHNLLQGQDDQCTHPSPSIKDTQTLYDIYTDRTVPDHNLPIQLPKIDNSNKIDQDALEKLITKLYGASSIKKVSDKIKGRSSKKIKDFKGQSRLVNNNSSEPDAAEDQRQENQAVTTTTQIPEVLWLPIKKEKSLAILPKGCYDIMKKNGETVINYYFGFGIFLIISSVLMSILYIQNCLKVRRQRKEDIQTILEMGQSPRPSILEPDFTTEEYTQILEELKNPKKKLPVGSIASGRDSNNKPTVRPQVQRPTRPGDGNVSVNVNANVNAIGTGKGIPAQPTAGKSL